jgi:hypothetical protein
MVEHCIANFGGDCAIISVDGEVASTPEPQHLPYGVKVDALNTIKASQKVNTAFTAHFIKATIAYDKQLKDTKKRLNETEALLRTALNDKKTLADRVAYVEAQLVEKMAQAKLEARLKELPKAVQAQIKKEKDSEIFNFLRTASEPEWNLARHTFALASHKSFAELSEEEGKLPVGGGTANEGKGNLQQYLR